MSDEPVVTTPGEVELTTDEKTMALVAHVVPIATAVMFMGWVPGLVILLTAGEKSEFARYHAIQSLLFNTVVPVAFGLIYVVTCSCGALVLLPLLLLLPVAQLYVGIQAYGGSWMGYPGLEKFGRS